MANQIGGNVLVVGGVWQMGAEFWRAKRPNFAPIFDYRCREHDCIQVLTLRGEVMAVAVRRKITLR